jgi:tRNA pseudouridine38-40 synthase
MRIAAAIEYDGSGFLGWQRLSHGDSVQAAVESALSYVADHVVEVTCAGRTDSGVHAWCQVVHFDSESVRSTRAWVLGANAKLPHSVCLRWAQPVDPSFHARYAAVARRYRYSILNRPVRPALQRQMLTWERTPLDAAAMHQAAQALVGEHDFTSFRTVACQAKSPCRRIDEVQVRRAGEQVVMQIQANAFLHHMVRNIVGSLLPIGRGEQAPQWIAELLAARNRALAGPTAPPNGLLFVGPLYPAHFGLPAEASTSIAAAAVPA